MYNVDERIQLRLGLSQVIELNWIKQPFSPIQRSHLQRRCHHQIMACLPFELSLSLSSPLLTRLKIWLSLSYNVICLELLKLSAATFTTQRTVKKMSTALLRRWRHASGLPLPPTWFSSCYSSLAFAAPASSLAQEAEEGVAGLKKLLR